MSALCIVAVWSHAAEVDAQIQPQVALDNHIEFGISVDPATVPQSRGTAQLSGTRSTVSARVSVIDDRDRLSYRLTAAPSVDRYGGEDMFLAQFDAQRVPINLRAAFRSFEGLVRLRAHLGAARLESARTTFSSGRPSR